ncbi:MULTISPECIES: phage portal protein [Bradyrhizobium]|jgi:lambda family phage portal protein|nr:phage portal protein [Bradyrhizobium denitrificans]MCL8489367.1 phage portal protein [Bradyrhizobium denitrificans]
MSDDAKSMVPSPPPLQTAQGLHVQASFGPQHRHGWGSFDDSSDGSGQRLAWANRGRHDPLSLRNMSPYGLVQGGFSEADRNKAASTATELYMSSPAIHAMIETHSAFIVGEGLRFCSRPNHQALGITKEQAVELGDQIERTFSAWASSKDADYSGRFTLAQMMRMQARTLLRTGEAAVRFEWRTRRGVKTKTMLRPIEPVQIDQSRSGKLGPADDDVTIKGVTRDKYGMIKGYFVLDILPGDVVVSTQPKWLPAKTSFGRPHVGLYFDPLQASQARGRSPFAVSLTPAHEIGSLEEAQMAKNWAEASVVSVIKTNLTPAQAAGIFRTNDDISAGVAGSGGVGGVTSLADMVEARAAYYAVNPVTMDPGKIAVLGINDELQQVSAKTANENYQVFAKTLAREAAAAGGVNPLIVDPDYSAVNFSASRMSWEIDYTHVLHRRGIVAQMYQDALYCFVEEAIANGTIKLPKGAPAFWQDPAAFLCGCWIGKPRPSADPLKDAQTGALLISTGQATRAEVLAARGIDYEEWLHQLSYERERERELGLTFQQDTTPATKPDAEAEETDEPAPQPIKKGPRP